MEITRRPVRQPVNCFNVQHKTLREGFNKNQKKKVWNFPHYREEPPPPPKVWNKYFFLFHIWVLKSVLMRRNFFSFFSRVPTPDSRGTVKCRGTFVVGSWRGGVTKG